MRPGTGGVAWPPLPGLCPARRWASLRSAGSSRPEERARRRRWLGRGTGSEARVGPERRRRRLPAPPPAPARSREEFLSERRQVLQDLRREVEQHARYRREVEEGGSIPAHFVTLTTALHQWDDLAEILEKYEKLVEEVEEQWEAGRKVQLHVVKLPPLPPSPRGQRLPLPLHREPKPPALLPAPGASARSSAAGSAGAPE